MCASMCASMCVARRAARLQRATCLAYDRLDASLIASIEGLPLVWGAVLAPLLLGEEMTRSIAAGCLLVAVGCGLVGVGSTKQTPEYSYDDLLAIWAESRMHM